MNNAGEPKRKELDVHVQVLILRILADLDPGSKSVADAWEPPMTASGRQVALAREFEKRFRAFWRAYGSLDAVGHRRPEFKDSLSHFVESDDVFEFLTAEGCEEIIRLRALVGEIEDAVHE